MSIIKKIASRATAAVAFMAVSVTSLTAQEGLNFTEKSVIAETSLRSDAALRQALLYLTNSKDMLYGSDRCKGVSSAKKQIDSKFDYPKFKSALLTAQKCVSDLANQMDKNRDHYVRQLTGIEYFPFERGVQTRKTFTAEEAATFVGNQITMMKGYKEILDEAARKILAYDQSAPKRKVLIDTLKLDSNLEKLLTDISGVSGYIAGYDPQSSCNALALAAERKLVDMLLSSGLDKTTAHTTHLRQRYDLATRCAPVALAAVYGKNNKEAGNISRQDRSIRKIHDHLFVYN